MRHFSTTVADLPSHTMMAVEGNASDTILVTVLPHCYSRQMQHTKSAFVCLLADRKTNV